MSSFSENAAMNLLKETPVEFVKYLFRTVFLATSFPVVKKGEKFNDNENVIKNQLTEKFWQKHDYETPSGSWESNCRNMSFVNTEFWFYKNVGKIRIKF